MHDKLSMIHLLPPIRDRSHRSFATQFQTIKNNYKNRMLKNDQEFIRDIDLWLD